MCKLLLIVLSICFLLGMATKAKGAEEVIENAGKGYKERTVLEGKFYMYIKGKKDNPEPKEFAMMMWEGEPEYPLDFAVSKDGKNLYLLDNFNDRLQIFNSEDGRLLSSVKVETFKIADSIQIKESQESWNTMGFAFPIIEADSLFVDTSGNIIIVGKKRISSAQKGKDIYEAICYEIDNDDYSVNDLSEKIGALGKFPEESSIKMRSLEASKVKLFENGEKFTAFISKENDKKEVIIENNGRNINTNVEILGKASIYLDKNRNFTIVDKRFDGTAVWNIKWILNVYRIDSQDGKILEELTTKVDYYSSKLCLDEQGNIYYWERIPREGQHPYYESKGWRVVKLQGEN